MLVVLAMFMVSASMIRPPPAVGIPQHGRGDQRIKPTSLLLASGDGGAYRLDGPLLPGQLHHERLQHAVVTPLPVHATSNAQHQCLVTAMVRARDSGIMYIRIQP